MTDVCPNHRAPVGGLFAIGASNGRRGTGRFRDFTPPNAPAVGRRRMVSMSEPGICYVCGGFAHEHTEAAASAGADPEPDYDLDSLRVAIYDIVKDPSYDVTQDQVDDIIAAFRRAQGGPSLDAVDRLVRAAHRVQPFPPTPDIQGFALVENERLRELHDALFPLRARLAPADPVEET